MHTLYAKDGLDFQFCTARSTGDSGAMALGPSLRRGSTLDRKTWEQESCDPQCPALPEHSPCVWCPHKATGHSLVSSANYCFGCQAFLNDFCLFPILCWAHWAGISAVTGDKTEWGVPWVLMNLSSPSWGPQQRALRQTLRVPRVPGSQWPQGR